MDAETPRVEGEIVVTPSGDVVIGAPSAVAIVVPPTDDDEEEEATP